MNCFIGLNTTVKDGITIGAYNIVGSGANIIGSTSDYCLSYGNPAITVNKDNI